MLKMVQAFYVWYEYQLFSKKKNNRVLRFGRKGPAFAVKYISISIN